MAIEMYLLDGPLHIQVVVQYRYRYDTRYRYLVPVLSGGTVVVRFAVHEFNPHHVASKQSPFSLLFFNTDRPHRQSSELYGAGTSTTRT